MTWDALFVFYLIDKEMSGVGIGTNSIISSFHYHSQHSYDETSGQLEMHTDSCTWQKDNTCTVIWYVCVQYVLYTRYLKL